MKTLRAIKQLQWRKTELHGWTGYVQYNIIQYNTGGDWHRRQDMHVNVSNATGIISISFQNNTGNMC